VVKYIVILNGPARAGKDTFATALLSLPNVQGAELSMAGAVKQMLEEWWGVTVHQDKTDAKRKLWADVVDALMVYNKLPLLNIMNYIDRLDQHGEGEFIVVVHMRKPSEIQMLEKEYPTKCITLFVTRPDLYIPNNDADRAVFNCTYDCVINDAPLDQMRNIAELFKSVLPNILKEKNNHVTGRITNQVQELHEESSVPGLPRTEGQTYLLCRWNV